MTILKKLLSILLVFTVTPMMFGHFALQLKRELVIIDNFTKELRKLENTVEKQTLVTYLEDILKNDAGAWYHYDENTRFVSDDEVLAIVRILKADITLETKQSELKKIMQQEFEKDVKIKAQKIKEKWLAYLGIGSLVGIYVMIGLRPLYAK